MPLFRTLWNWRLDSASLVRRSLLLPRGLDLVPVMDRRSYLSLIRQVMSESQMRLNGCEAYHILTTVRAVVEKVPGDLAEVGVYRGGSSKLICEAKGDRHLHLFDTFSGLPELGPRDTTTVFWKGQFGSSLEAVRKYLSRYPNVHLYEGLFPDTASPIKRNQFCFVHLDVDLYEPTRAGLEFFYPKLSSGGILMSHDYDAPGVREAVNEFFKDKPETVLQQPAGSQCFVVRAGPACT